MSMNEQQILEEALKLSDKARLRIAEALWQESKPQDHPPRTALEKRAAERLKAYENGNVEMVDALESLKRVKERVCGRIKQSSRN